MSTRIRGTILAAATAAALAAAAPAMAEPAWAPAGSATIKPGSETLTDGAQCTSNFVFFDAANNVYIGQAAHCSGTDGNTATNGCIAGTLPTGTPVEIEGASRPGTIVYSSWATMQARGETNSNTCRFNDFALIQLDPADYGKVNPSIPFWGGPTGTATTTTQGDDVYSYGNSSLRFGAGPLKPKRGKSLGASGGGWTHQVYTASPGIPGDSGSAFIDEAGMAFGVLSTLQIAPLAGANGVSDLSRAQAYMEANGGPDVTLANGTEPFDGSRILSLGGRYVTGAGVEPAPAARSRITAVLRVPGLCVLPGRLDTPDRRDRPPTSRAGAEPRLEPRRAPRPSGRSAGRQRVATMGRGPVRSHNGDVDPYAILGVKAGAAPAEVAAAYRREAKRWHPDRGGGEESALRMAQVNAAYDLLRAGDFAPPSAPRTPAPRGRSRPARGAWLAPAIRRALGGELLEALEPEEDVRLVTPTATWASARALLAVTDRRLLWLLDDVVTSRVGWLRFNAIASVEQRLRRPRRRVAVLRIETTAGRRLAFAELRPATAEAIARHIASARRAA